MADIGIYGKLVNRTPDNILVGAEQVFDGNYGTDGSDQQAINAQLAAALATIEELSQRIDNLEVDAPPHVVLTQAQYDALETKDASTFYFTYEE